jgi:hypothetical protein
MFAVTPDDFITQLHVAGEFAVWQSSQLPLQVEMAHLALFR